MKFSVERVEDQAKISQGCGTQQGLIPFLAENDGGSAAVPAILEICVANLPSHDGAVGKREIELLVRSDTKGLEPFGRN